VFIIGVLFSFKFFKLLYTRFGGSDKYYARFDFPSRFHKIMDIFTVVNIMFVLLPLIGIDLYAFIKYNWGGQFYIIVIETFLLSVAILPLTIYEMLKV